MPRAVLRYSRYLVGSFFLFVALGCLALGVVVLTVLSTRNFLPGIVIGHLVLLGLVAPTAGALQMAESILPFSLEDYLPDC